jgi:hypothetical protein
MSKYLIILLVLITGVLLFRQMMPDIQRYMRIRSM